MLIFSINRRNGIRFKEHNMTKNNHSIPIHTLLKKTILIGLKVKTPFSLLVSALSIPAAFLPLIISRKLQELTDQLFLLSSHTEIHLYSVIISMLFLGLAFILQVFCTFLM